jgi:hypothetical protein
MENFGVRHLFSMALQTEVSIVGSASKWGKDEGKVKRDLINPAIREQSKCDSQLLE